MVYDGLSQQTIVFFSLVKHFLCKTVNYLLLPRCFSTRPRRNPYKRCTSYNTMYIIQLNMNLAHPNDAKRFGRKRSDLVCLAENLARQGSTRRNEGKTCILWINFPIGIERCTSWLGGGWFSTIFFPMIRHIFTMFIHKPRHFLTPISLPETLLGSGVLQSKPDLAITTLNPDMMS